MSALVRITTGIMPQHSRVGFTRGMSQFGEVIHCHKPPYAGIPGEDFVNVRFANQEAADRAYAALKAGTVYIDGMVVGVGPQDKPPSMGGGGGGGGGGGRPQQFGNGMPRRYSPSPPRRFARNRQGGRSPSRGRGRSPRRRRSPSRRRGGSPARPNFPSRGDAKSISPRRMARDMNMSIRDRSRSRDGNRRVGRALELGGFSGGVASMALTMPMKEREPARSPSPDPPGPMRSNVLVKNPFFNPDRSSPASD
eukprot:TRINITY_DN35551_c0_g1_i1.p1 TRINITY_DN35551_c0_g1~~TRINITY_DN35551_c0_g1_i1.p1  ORF type:complete len:252 (+),score=23.31 TRINITY_DN35551_c0_g1_i1:158-913(+)